MKSQIWYRNIRLVENKYCIEGERHWSPNERRFAPSQRVWIKFRATRTLFAIGLAMDLAPEATKVFWSMQDGYGSPGHTPVQGFDWSGIRDSKPETIRAMFAKAKEFLTPLRTRMSEIGLPDALIHVITNHKFVVRLSVPMQAWANVEVNAQSEDEAEKIALEQNERGEVSFEYGDYSNSDAEVTEVEEVEYQSRK